MKRSYLNMLIACMFFVFLISISGVCALWRYFYPSESQVNDIAVSMSSFKYGTLYITDVSIEGGIYNRANSVKTGAVNISTDIVLNSDETSSCTVKVTFYNSTNVSYYYNKTDTISLSNNNIEYTVTGIEQKDEVAPKTFKTVYVTFAYSSSNISNSSILSELHFNFVIDKDSIGSIVAMTAVDRFRDILNNKVSENSYQTLEDAMNNRSGVNKASAVTYIGNVSGSSSADSKVIEDLFGEAFMSMDLDGDGQAEPITMMIKRENIDNDITTGDSYTYTNFWRQYTVNGADMTLYITSANLNNVSSGQSIVVYAASFTKLEGAVEWTELIPLTKGTANANNYSGYGSANSFNTDTWKSDDQKSIEELIQ